VYLRGQSETFQHLMFVIASWLVPQPDKFDANVVCRHTDSCQNTVFFLLADTIKSVHNTCNNIYGCFFFRIPNVIHVTKFLVMCSLCIFPSSSVLMQISFPSALM
jgi:hypothetical protein